jgi:hypothetical protein
VSLAQAAPEPQAGRMCPVDYHYLLAVFDRPNHPLARARD